MIRAAFWATAALALVSTGAYAECTGPGSAEIPDGSTASYDEMVAAQSAVRAYLAAMEDFLACINEEIDAQDEETPEEARAALVERYNAAVTDMESTGARFNEELGAYRAANPSN